MRTKTYPRYKSFNFDMEALYDRIQAAKTQIAEDAAEQARRTLGETDERPLPYDYQSDYVPTEKASER
jgi:hypothetical protein